MMLDQVQTFSFVNLHRPPPLGRVTMPSSPTATCFNGQKQQTTFSRGLFAVSDDEQEDDGIEEEKAVVEEDSIDEEDDDEEDIEIDVEELFEEEDDDDDENEIILQQEDEYEYEEQYEVVEPEDEDDGDDGVDYELQDDPNDPNYTRQKELMEESIAARDQIAIDKDFDALDFLRNKMTAEEATEFDESDFMKQVMEQSKNMMLTEEDVMDIDPEVDVDAVPDLMDEPYPVHGPGEENFLEQNTGITDQDMVELNDAWKTAKEAEKNQEQPWDKVSLKADGLHLEDLSEETVEDLDNCLREIGGAAYNCTKWLLYDLDFNVTNLILAACKHNREAPILYEHWYPQLLTYKRYQYVRDGGFDWTWDDVNKADMSELERYYAGFGYDKIPKKAPSETGIISLEDLDEEEIRMAAFEKWVSVVYNSEWDRKDFDDDKFRDEDNVFSEYFEYPVHPDLPKYEEAQQELEEWEQEMNSTDPDDIEYREFIGRNVKYQIDDDKEFTEVFRGHLVVACTGLDSDLEIAEKITLRMAEEYGKQVFVETRVMAHAREEDNCFEVWLESYEIDLLHSKKRASMNAKGWEGPMECDDKQVEHLVDRVGFLISDDARYSYRMYDEEFEGNY